MRPAPETSPTDATAIVASLERGKNRWKSRIRAKVEHGIGVIKRVFSFTKVRYRGLAKKPTEPVSHVVSPICSSLDVSYCRSDGTT
jgi:hypothetical protein